jgi:hypothetical protein
MLKKVPESLLRIWLFFIALNLIGRTFCILDYPIFSDVQSSLLLAISSDIIFSIIPALLFYFLNKKSKHASWVFFVLWCFMLAANREYIAENNSNIELVDITIAWSSEFVLGSTINQHFILGFATILLQGIAAYLIAHRINTRFLYVLSLIMLPLAGGYSLLKSPSETHWLNANILHENIKNTYADLIDSQDATKPNGDSKAFYKQVFGKNLNGKLLITPKPNSNILVITVESLSQEFFDLGWMPKTTEIAKRRGWHFTNATVNRITAAGIYALMCSHPYLPKYKPRRLTKEIERHKRYCLPTLLSQHDYYSEYIKASSLRYRNEGEHSRIMGFSRALGKEQLNNQNNVSRWGIDDASLYEETKQRIRLANQGEHPWLIQTMSVVTHMPYATPDTFMPNIAMDQHEKAYRFADQSLADFINWLESESYLENTLIIITADESRATNFKDRLLNGELGRNHGVFILLADGLEARVIDDPVMQTDLPITILDYLGLAEQTDTWGRSMFRHYSDFRPQLFSMEYSWKTYALMKEHVLTNCNMRKKQCNNLTFEGDSIFNAKQVGAPQPLSDKEKRIITPFFN